MTFRAVLLGLAFALAVTLATCFNDRVIGGTMLTGNHLPVAVFGPLVAALLIINPLLARFTATRHAALSASEIAIVTALALSACAWPSSNFLRYFPAAVSLPGHAERTQPAWQAVNVLSYVPGSSARLAEGYVTDFPAFATALANGPRFAPRFDASEQTAFQNIAAGSASPDDRRALLTAVNRLLADPHLFEDADTQASEPRSTVERRNRARLAEAFPNLVRPQTPGSGVLLNHGDPDTPALDGLITGAPPGTLRTPADVPWSTWWPTLRLWAGLVLLVGLASLCIAVVVHPQWSRHEMLPYPIARFVQELAARDERASALPAIARSRLFWLGLGAVAALHLVNGLHTWFEQLPQITRQFDFMPLKDLFPNASRDSKVNYLFTPIFFPAVVGFGYFLNTRVSLSLGLALPLWLAFASLLTASGVEIIDGRFVPEANRPAIRFGAFVAAVFVILYYGRRYYLQVAAGAIGLRSPDAPRSAVWAARFAVLLYAAAVALLAHDGGVSPILSACCIALVLASMLVIARINVETGMFFVQPEFLPATLLASLLGFRGLGPEAYIVLTIASVVLFADPRATLMPFLANALRLGDSALISALSPRSGGGGRGQGEGGVGRSPATEGAPGCERPLSTDPHPSPLPFRGRERGPILARFSRLSPLLALVVTLGLILSVVVALTILYNVGFNPADAFDNRLLPNTPFDRAAAGILSLSSTGELADATARTGLASFLHMDPAPSPLVFAAVGAAFYLACAAARIRLPWWPLHPVIFLVWGSLASSLLAASFLLAAAVKAVVARWGGEKAYHQFRPFMVGLIAGDLLSALAWALTAAATWLLTGTPPPSYTVFP